jgi:DNA-binding HxlR family transcriptional regulator
VKSAIGRKRVLPARDTGLGTVSDRVLIQQFKELEADGLVKRTDYKGSR